MSAFGYGSSYQEKQSQPSMGAPGGPQQLVPANTPGYAGTNYAPVTPQPMNFNPEARNPWETPSYIGAQSDWFRDPKSGKSRNPFYSNFGGQNSFNAPAQGDPRYQGFVDNTAKGAPSDFNQMYAQINNLNADQLRNIDMRGTYDQQFRNASQDFSDMFANQTLAAQVQGGKDFMYGFNTSPDATDWGSRYVNGQGRQALDMNAPERQFNQQNTGNWLEGAYNSLVSKLNDAYLL